MKLTFTKAPMTPKLVSLKYSKGLVLLEVLRNGYRYKGICAKPINGESKELHDQKRTLFSYHAKTEYEFRYDWLHIEVKPKHCTLGWKHRRSRLEGSTMDTPIQSLGVALTSHLSQKRIMSVRRELGCIHLPFPYHMSTKVPEQDLRTVPASY